MQCKVSLKSYAWTNIIYPWYTFPYLVNGHSMSGPIAQTACFMVRLPVEMLARVLLVSFLAHSKVNVLQCNWFNEKCKSSMNLWVTHMVRGVTWSRWCSAGCRGCRGLERTSAEPQSMVQSAAGFPQCREPPRLPRSSRSGSSQLGGPIVPKSLGILDWYTLERGWKQQCLSYQT